MRIFNTGLTGASYARSMKASYSKAEVFGIDFSTKHRWRKDFLAEHLLAGTEFSSPETAVADLFDGKTIILCEAESTRRELREKEQEKNFACVSHLSHISSSMLGKTVPEKEKNESIIFDLAGRGFASTVRLDKSFSSKIYGRMVRGN